MWWIVLVIFATAVVSPPEPLNHDVLAAVQFFRVCASVNQWRICHDHTFRPSLPCCVQVVSVCTFLLQWSGCCVQHTDHTGTHVRVQMGWGYGFDMHRGQLDGKAVFALLLMSYLSVWAALTQIMEAFLQ